MLAVAAGGFGGVRASGGPAGEKIEFSEAPATTPVVVSNLNRLDPNPSGFKQVQEDLLRPFSSLDPRNMIQMPDTMNGPIAPPPRPTQGPLSKRAIEMLDRKRNWAFSTYEELSMGQDEAERKMFGIKEYGADGQEKQTRTAIDRYYQSLDGKNLTATNQTAQEARAAFIRENGFDPLGKTTKSKDPFVKEMFGFDEPDTVADKPDGIVPPGMTDKNGTGIPGLEDGRMQLKHLEDVRHKILGDAAARAGKPVIMSSPFLTADENSQKTKSSVAGLLNQQLSDAAELRQRSGNPYIVADPTANALHSHINDDLTARALGLPNPLKPQTNSVTRPTAQSIQSQFDPFGAGRPKPRF
jgi:hypothetical protein